MSVRGFIILDFGSQVTMLIARRLRELGYYALGLTVQSRQEAK